jgi:hypothetical protein
MLRQAARGMAGYGPAERNGDSSFDENQLRDIALLT